MSEEHNDNRLPHSARNDSKTSSQGGTTQTSLRGGTTKQSPPEEHVTNRLPRYARNDDTKQPAPRVPALRFKEFDGDWKVSKLGDYCTFSQGIQVDVELQSREPKEGYIRFLRIENYTQKSQDFRYIPLNVAGKKRIKADEIAVVRYGATAGFISKGFDGVLANNLFKVIPDEEIFTLTFLFEHLNSHRAFSFFQAEMSGGAMPALSFGIVKALKVPVTSLPEQQKIASFLSAVDEKIQQLSKKKALLAQYKKGVMQQLFSGQLRFKPDPSNETSLRGTKQSLQNEAAFPDWEEKQLSQVLEQQVREVPKPSINYLAIGIRSHVKGTFQKPNSDPKKIAMEKLFVVKENDLVVNITFAWEGAIAIVKKEDDGGLVSHRFPTYTFKSNHTSKEYFKQVIIDKKFRFTLDLISPGGAGRNRVLSKKEFVKIKWSFPCIEEQQKIATYLSRIDTKIGALNNQITQTQTFKKGLLQQLFV